MRALLIALLASAGVCFTGICSAQTDAVSGVVKSEGQAIPGAIVRATQGGRSLTTLTDANGAFRLEGMGAGAGAWSVEVDMFGFDRARKEIQVAANPTKIDFNLQLRDRARRQTSADAALS
ncbi:MAG: carboxypeptidase-like regulatory domain-containing protein, partial [Bryobacteraceae bacterium]